EPFEIAPVLRDLCGHPCRIEIDGALMREGMAGDLVTVATEFHDATGIDAVTMVIGPIDQAAGDIKGAAAANLLQNRRADGGRAQRDVVEGEAHHRLAALESHRRGKEVPGEPVG